MSRKGRKAQKQQADPRQQIEAALEVRDPVKFVYAMRDIVFGVLPGVSLDERPDAIAMVGGLCQLNMAVANGGMREFLDRPEGAFFHEIETYCRTVGASRASAYLGEAAKLFPKGRVPKDDEKRFDLASAYEPTSPVDPPDPFNALDRKYEDAMPQMLEQLRVWARENTDTLAAELAAA